jgi:hypothetical protein
MACLVKVSEKEKSEFSHENSGLPLLAVVINVLCGVCLSCVVILKNIETDADRFKTLVESTMAKHHYLFALQKAI